MTHSWWNTLALLAHILARSVEKRRKSTFLAHPVVSVHDDDEQRHAHLVFDIKDAANQTAPAVTLWESESQMSISRTNYAFSGLYTPRPNAPAGRDIVPGRRRLSARLTTPISSADKRALLGGDDRRATVECRY